MPALDYWDIAAKRPSCLMAVTPYRGGTWASMLKPGVAMPSATPRNFAMEPATWYNAARAYADADWSHDFTFRFEFEISSNTDGSIFYAAPASTMFCLYQYSTGRINTFTSILKASSGFTNYVILELHPAGSFLSGRHVAKMVVSGTTVTVYLDEVLVTSAMSQPRNTPSSFVAPGSTRSYIYDAFIRDDTTGKTVWSYPTWAEDKRLLTFTNVRTDRGVFEAANTSLGWSIKTQLTGTAGTVIERRPSGVYVNSGKFNASTGIYTGLAADQLLTLLAFDYTLTAAEIAQFK